MPATRTVDVTPATTFADELYAKLRVPDDGDGRIDLRSLCDAMGAMFSEVETFVREGRQELVLNPYLIGDANLNPSVGGEYEFDAEERDPESPDFPTMHFTSNSNNAGLFVWPFNVGVIPGHTYDLTIRVKAEPGFVLSFWHDFYADVSADTWIEGNDGTFTQTGEWQTATKTVTAPEGAMSMDFGLYPPAATGVEWHLGKHSATDQADDALVPWSRLADPQASLNAATLLWLAQLAGVRIPVGTVAADMRDLIELAESRRRGTVEYMVEVAQRLLTGDKFVWVNERDAGSAYRLAIVTRTDETPDAAAVEAALRAVKPAGIVLSYDVSDGVTWNEPVHAWNAAGAVTWDESQDTVP